MDIYSVDPNELYTLYNDGNTLLRNPDVIEKLSMKYGVQISRSFPAFLAAYDTTHLTGRCTLYSSVNNCMVKAAAVGNLQLFKHYVTDGGQSFALSFLEAVKSGNWEIAEMSYASTTVDSREKLLDIALKESAKNNRSKAIEWLIGNINDPNFEYLMVGAIEADNMPLVNWVIENYNVKDYRLPIVYAAGNGHIQLTQRLLKDESDRFDEPEIVYEDMLPEIANAAAKGGHEDIVSWALSEYTGDATIINNEVLIGASSGGHTDLIAMAVENGADVFRQATDAASDNGQLHSLISLGKMLPTSSERIMNRLLNDNVSQEHIWTVVNWLIERGSVISSDALSKIARLGHLELLKSAAKDADYNDILLAAASNGKIPIVRWSLENGADNVSDAVLVAASNNMMETLNWLSSKYKLNYNEIMKRGAQHGHLQVVKWASDRGADNHENVIRGIGGGNRNITQWLLNYVINRGA